MKQFLLIFSIASSFVFQATTYAAQDIKTEVPSPVEVTPRIIQQITGEYITANRGKNKNECYPRRFFITYDKNEHSLNQVGIFIHNREFVPGTSVADFTKDPLKYGPEVYAEFSGTEPIGHKSYVGLRTIRQIQKINLSRFQAQIDGLNFDIENKVIQGPPDLVLGIQHKRKEWYPLSADCKLSYLGCFFSGGKVGARKDKQNWQFRSGEVMQWYDCVSTKIGPLVN